MVSLGFVELGIHPWLVPWCAAHLTTDEESKITIGLPACHFVAVYITPILTPFAHVRINDRWFTVHRPLKSDWSVEQKNKQLAKASAEYHLGDND